MAHPNRLEDRVRLLEMADGLPLELVRIPGGTFRMGSPEDEPGRWDSEGPQHAVTVPSFLMGRYPVTQAQWRAVAELPLGKRSLDPDPAYFKGADRPVEQVSWYEAVEFCDRLANRRNARTVCPRRRNGNMLVEPGRPPPSMSAQP